MLHAAPARSARRSAFMARRRVQLIGALLFSAVLPYALRIALTPGTRGDHPALNTFIGNCAAVVVALWMRLSVEPYPGVRSSSLVLPVATASHGLIVLAILLLRLPYDRAFLLGGYVLHLGWLYLTYFIIQRRSVLSIGIVPFGQGPALADVPEILNVEWRTLLRPDLVHIGDCQAIVADFGADLPPAWERFLADAALDGRIVYQVKQLSESLTGRVEIGHISENSFGSLLPARGYFHLKAMLDSLLAVLSLPVVVPVVAAVAIAIKAERTGPVFYRQERVGHAGHSFRVVKFRTMRARPPGELGDDRHHAITLAGDDRITPLGRLLRHSRLDELPQVWNILRGQMSWIGPRPEAAVLSAWYTGEIPFYRYRHVVKPGISGWAQVNQGHVAQVDDVHRKLQYDFYYIKYFSPWLDLLIVFRTIKTMLTGFGSR